MPQAATIKSLPRAFRMMKAIQAEGIEWGEDYRGAAAGALKEVLEGRMAAGIDHHLAEMAARGAADRRNGSYRRWLGRLIYRPSYDATKDQEELRKVKRQLNVLAAKKRKRAKA